MKTDDSENLAGCCGLFCGLCNKYQSSAPSRCIGCKLGEQHSWCSIWNCCVKKHGFETCAECNNIFKCDIHKRRKVSEWIPAADNLLQIKKSGLDSWLQNQKERKHLVDELLRNYNEGRSLSFFCKVCSRMSVDLVRNAISESNLKCSSQRIEKTDVKSKRKILKEIIENLAEQAKINLN